jgi:hypothetical protein
MDLTIHGSIEPYIWTALWGVTLGGLQRSGPPIAERVASGPGGRVQVGLAVLGNAASFGIWGLGLWVCFHHSIVTGVILSVFGFAMNVAALALLQRIPPHGLTVQFSYLALMLIFGSQAFASVGALPILGR